MGYLFEISGRITRLQYWLGVLLNFAIMFVGVLALSISVGEDFTDEAISEMLIPILIVWGVCFWINISITVQRYHDHGKSGFWFFICLVPFVGPIWQLVECGCLAGDQGPNAYGDNPAGNNNSMDESVYREVEAIRAAAGGGGEQPSTSKLGLDNAMANAVKQHQNAAAPSGTAMRTSAASAPVFGKRA